MNTVNLSATKSRYKKSIAFQYTTMKFQKKRGLKFVKSGIKKKIYYDHCMPANEMKWAKF